MRLNKSDHEISTVFAFPTYLGISCGDVVIGSTVNHSNIIGQPSKEIMFALNLSSERIITISTCTNQTNFSTHLTIVNSTDFSQIFCSNNAQNCSQNSGLSVIRSCLISSGNYVLVVEGFGFDEGNFAVSVSCSKGNLTRFLNICIRNCSVALVNTSHTKGQCSRVTLLSCSQLRGVSKIV